MTTPTKTSRQTKEMFVDRIGTVMSSVYRLKMSDPINETNITSDTSPDEGTSVSLVLPIHLHRKLKSEAALAGRHLKAYIVGLLAQATEASK